MGEEKVSPGDPLILVKTPRSRAGLPVRQPEFGRLPSPALS